MHHCCFEASKSSWSYPHLFVIRVISVIGVIGFIREIRVIKMFRVIDITHAQLINPPNIRLIRDIMTIWVPMANSVIKALRVIGVIRGYE
jgi:hypothetical protein